MIFRDVKGARMPALGLGTWQLEGPACVDAIEYALSIGYRHVDTAVRYGNEAAVGAGIRQSGVARDDLFVTTKVWHDSLEYDQVLRSAADSLDRLGLDRVDLFLVHWPNPQVPLAETMAAMAEVAQRGWTRHIGVSNFTTPLIKHVVDDLQSPVVANQIERHALLAQPALFEAMRDRGLVIEAYQPLGGGKLLADATLGEIAQRYARPVSQIALRWLMQQADTVAIPRSTQYANIASNIDIFNFALDPADVAKIDALQNGTRFINPAFAPEWG